ncbi:UNVERIFIED_CONTAM: hypothetical protein FKN15_000396 [Acipenser sinensis]
MLSKKEAKDDLIETALLDENLLDGLQRRFFSCNKKGFSLEDLKNQFGNMQEKGVYKAMGELGLFFNYIEEYLTAKRHH